MLTAYAIGVTVALVAAIVAIIRERRLRLGDNVRNFSHVKPPQSRRML